VLYAGYDAIAESAPWLGDLLAGIAAAAVGFLLTIAFASARRVAQFIPGLVIFFATFVCVGILRWPLVPVVIALGIPSVIAAAMRKRS
jgi:chromate transporter